MAINVSKQNYSRNLYIILNKSCNKLMVQNNTKIIIKIGVVKTNNSILKK